MRPIDQSSPDRDDRFDVILTGNNNRHAVGSLACPTWAYTRSACKFCGGAWGLLHGQNIPFKNRYPREQWEGRPPIRGFDDRFNHHTRHFRAGLAANAPLRGYIVARASSKSPIAHLKGAVSLTHL